MPKPQAAQPTKAARHPRAGSVETGDHVYVHHPEDGPMPVRVLAHGRDGITGECAQGRRHAVRWDRILGHKSRVQMALKVLDAGQEGAIVEDERGKRRFLAGDLTPAPADAGGAPPRRDPLLDGLDTLAKAIDAGRPVLLLKAGTIKNAPGLTLKDVTDSRGHQTKRWVRTMKDQPKPRERGQAEDASKPAPPSGLKHGDSVTFKHGEVTGEGRIIASGRDGVTVRGADGQTHQVRHDALAAKATERGPLDPDKMDNPDHRPTSIGAVMPSGFRAHDFAAQHDQADKATVDAILSRFPPDTKQKMEAINQRLRGVTETKTQHFKDGAYTPERAALHADIMGRILSPERIKAATPKEGEKPTFTILGGRGGSGKSWFKGKVYDDERAIVLDADEIKHMLPEYEGWNAFQVHEESGDIFDAITKKATEFGLHIVHDATMKTASKAVALVKGFKDAGYRVEAHYMHLPRAEAAHRAVKRFLGPTGRYVPPEVILGNTGNEAAFDQVKELADAWSFRDNQNHDGSGPRLISEKHDAGQGGGRSDGPGDNGQDGRDGRAANRAGPDGADQRPSMAGKDAGGTPLRKGGPDLEGRRTGAREAARHTSEKAARPSSLALIRDRVLFWRRWP